MASSLEFLYPLISRFGGGKKCKLRWVGHSLHYIATPGKNNKGQLRYRMIYKDPRPDGRTNYRYIYPQEIVNYFKRREIEQIPKEILDRRVNVEATIHQVFCKLSKKSRYRGLLPNHFMTLGRCFWTNCTRIT